MESLDRHLESQSAVCEAELCELLRIPSVSADSRHAPDMQQAASWLVGKFTAAGLKCELVPTAGHPIVYAEWLQAPGAPTVLVYGHYDVQPPDPLGEWISPPFEPTIRNGNVYARGATDDKGQMLTHLFSVRAWLQSSGKLPVNVKFLIEGEEEVGSENLDHFIQTNRERLKCDVVVISDTCQLGPNQPAITYGLRGISYHEIWLQGPKQDLHSGTFGGAIANPANVLAKMLAAMIDDQGRIQLPGFYDAVEPITAAERAEIAKLPFDEAAFMAQLGVKGLQGEVGYNNLERRWARPTFDINGITSGYQGEGAKTVLPAKSSAKFSFRLVPKQDPEQINQALDRFLQQRCPPGIELTIKHYHGAPGVVVPLGSPYLKAAMRAIELGFGHQPYFIREGGSIPVVSTFYQLLGVDTLLLGWGLNDDNTHSPNEKFCLADFHRGIKASAYLWQELSGLHHA